MAHINPAVVSGTLSAASTSAATAIGPFQYRSSQSRTLDALRISIRGTFSATVDLRVCDPGLDPSVAANAAVVKTYTAVSSDVFVPGGSCDIWLYVSAYTSGSVTGSIIT